MLQNSTGDATRHDSVIVVAEGTRLRLKQELKKRRISEVEFAQLSGVSYTWLRRILGGDNAGEDARAKIRAALEICTVCGCKMTVPPDDVLFAVATRRRRTKA